MAFVDISEQKRRQAALQGDRLAQGLVSGLEQGLADRRQRALAAVEERRRQEALERDDARRAEDVAFREKQFEAVQEQNALMREQNLRLKENEINQRRASEGLPPISITGSGVPRSPMAPPEPAGRSIDIASMPKPENLVASTDRGALPPTGVAKFQQIMSEEPVRSRSAQSMQGSGKKSEQPGFQNLPLSAQKKILDIERSQSEATKRLQETKKGKQLSAKDVQNFNEGAQVPNTLKDIQGTIEANEDIFGPFEGRSRSYNPYDVQAQTIDAQMRAASQQFGRYMEGGVLRKEDEDKYRKMFPQLADTPQVAKNKLAIVQRLLATKQNNDIAALKKSGYDVSGIESNLEAPPIPEAIRPKGQTQQTSPMAQHPQANEALQWARQNPDDPRAQQIMQRLGAQ